MTKNKITREQVWKDAVLDTQMRMVERLDYCKQTTWLAESLSFNELKQYIRYGNEFRVEQELEEKDDLNSSFGSYIYFYERINLMKDELTRRFAVSLVDKLKD
ncbi:hypothetical protein J4438_03325 [Candidatus Woesearchaeota archaeon]|nr:hypothetical protein [Candidatus Woesearchaeota archaeon]